MRVVIVSRTRMGSRRCIGGLDANFQSVRLEQASGANWPTSSPFQIGEEWEMDLTKLSARGNPHSEDFAIANENLIGPIPSMVQYLNNNSTQIGNNFVTGNSSVLFQGLINYNDFNTGYITNNNIPTFSTGFWIPDDDLLLDQRSMKHYLYDNGGISGRLKYVGEPDPINVIPAKTICRVSLAGWWRPSGATIDYCFLQLSGWY